MGINKYENLIDTVVMGEYMLKFEKEDNLESYYVKKAAQELRENEETKVQSLKELKRLILDEENWYVPLDDEDIDVFLYAYLRVCKFYVNSAFEKIKTLFDCKLKYAEYFSHIVPMTERNIFQSNILTVLPLREQHGRRILIIQLGKKWKTNECSLTEIIRGILLIIEAAMLEPRTQISGAVTIIDMEGLCLQHVWQFNPTFAKMLLHWVQNSLPIRLKAIHVVNQPYLFNMVFAIFKPFIDEKLRSRIYLHGNDPTSSLLKHIDKKYVPVQYGGVMNISLNEGLKQWNLLCSYNHKYERTSKYGFKENPARKRIIKK